ncbi:Gfo/Idh/MocA family protein [Patulibacter defluvii]|uniref:Gfo/Idh/MocA family protein n=1 Tax=Patulibacter defluvii TaxID=3095358 RepID=UPI002A75FFE8|nr:Gfo/Idh/MocA family oxidoreductase [Patulibacter sp. DM4]
MSGTAPDGSEVRIGMVGSGFIAGLHSRALRAVGYLPGPSPQPVLQRLASRNRATAAELAARFGWRSTTTDWRAVTRDPEIDVVAICTPDAAHREVAEDAFAHGKHVFCEKPLAGSAADARAMAAAADRHDGVQFVGFVLRCWPALEHARRTIAAGELGPLRNVRARYLLDSETLLESSLRGLGSHVLDALVVLAGPVDAVAATTRPTAADPEIDGRAAVLLEFASGSTGVLEVDREARGRAMDLVIEADCEHGGLTIGWRTRDVVAVHRVAGGVHQIPMGPRTSPFPIAPLDGLGYALDDLFAVQARQLLMLVAGEHARYPTFGDALHVAEATDAILDAAATRGWRAVPRPAEADGPGR